MTLMLQYVGQDVKLYLEYMAYSYEMSGHGQPRHITITVG